jgi:hypothetical protein
VTGVMGCALLVTRDCFEAAGGFTEEIQVYYEDVDFCLAARARGFGAMIAPLAVVRHDGMRGFAAGLTPWAAFLKARNPWLVVRRHGSPLTWLTFVPTYSALVLASAAIYAARGRGDVVRALGRGVRAGVAAAFGRRAVPSRAAPEGRLVRVGIGALVGVLGGPATYARELIGALARIGGHEYVVFTDRPDAFADVAPIVHVPLRTSYHQVMWDHWALPGLVADQGVQLYHGTKNVLPWRLPVPGVVTVHDLAVYACPETFALPQRLHLRALIPRSVARGVRVVADSEHARGDILTRFRRPARARRRDPAGRGRRLSQRGGRGRGGAAPPHTRARRARGRLRRDGAAAEAHRARDRGVRAHGRGGGGLDARHRGRVRPHHAPPWLSALPPGARFLGPLDDDDLRALYATAAIAMSASEYEGFGLTVLEAMAGGCAVDRRRDSVDPEVVGDAGVLVAALGRRAPRRRARGCCGPERRTRRRSRTRPPPRRALHVGGDRAAHARGVRGGARDAGDRRRRPLAGRRRHARCRRGARCRGRRGDRGRQRLAGADRPRLRGAASRAAQRREPSATRAARTSASGRRASAAPTSCCSSTTTRACARGHARACEVLAADGASASSGRRC